MSGLLFPKPIKEKKKFHFIQPGKKTKAWNKDRKKLKTIYKDKGIINCELNLIHCWHFLALSFAHKHKRSWYNTRPELLGSFNQTLLACVPCHRLIEHDLELTTKLFNKLRPESDKEEQEYNFKHGF